ncbi:MAG: sensor histidine kinase [Christensenellaceae bacterium]|jgi:two-component system sensor histidine kinase CiaH
MIKKLQLKLIAISMAVLVIVFVIVFLTINIFMQTSSEKQTADLLSMVAEQDGLMLPPEEEMGKKEMMPMEDFPQPERMQGMRLFYVKVDGAGTVLEVNFERMFDYTEEDVLAVAEKAFANEKTKSTMDGFQYLIVEKSYGKIAVFAERNVEIRMLEELLQLSLYVAAGTFILLLFFSLLFSKWAVKPVEVAFQKQQRFVSDASHELKTPHTIMGANIDVLENEIGSNERITALKGQMVRMNLLISDLLTLAKADDEKNMLHTEYFSLSKTVENTTLEFESTAFEAGKSLHYQIEADIMYLGDAAKMKQLTAILLDNAIKYSDENGDINVMLQKRDSEIIFAVSNTGTHIPEAEREKIFDRFYRRDISRARETGGYGLGLAIAKSIVEAHQGKITVSGQEGLVVFTVRLSANASK